MEAMTFDRDRRRDVDDPFARRIAEGEGSGWVPASILLSARLCIRPILKLAAVFRHHNAREQHSHGKGGAAGANSEGAELAPFDGLGALHRITKRLGFRPRTLRSLKSSYIR